MIVKLQFFSVFFSVICTSYSYGGEEFDVHKKKLGLRDHFFLAQAAEEQSREIIGDFGLSELTRLDKQVRENSEKHEDLDSRLEKLMFELKTLLEQQNDGFEQLALKIRTLEDRLNLSVSESNDKYRNLRNNLEGRLSIIEDALVQKPQDNTDMVIESMSKRIGSLEELMIKLSEDSETTSLQYLEDRLKFIEDSLLTKIDQLLMVGKEDESENNEETVAQGVTKKLNDQSDPALVAYGAAIARYNREDFLGAIDMFSSFIKKYPSHSLVSNAHYWVGNSYFALKEYDLAIKTETIILTSYPDSKKVPDALLLIGSSHKHLGNIEDARERWATLINRFPNSDSARKAAKRLGDLP